MRDETKTYTVVIHDDAAQMLYSHIRFIANVSISAAHKLRDTLQKGFLSLESMPYRCPVYRTHRTADTYRHLIVGRYQVIFSIDEDESTVAIQYIIDSRQVHDSL
ncbi:MAG: type II toxin-antitoxin system RelE/ParE family toxin [Peptococcaceae bacterium]|jgi:plasmid stabilization system protein ParE|nr:type II toxin-antitoxin system RelE/ParE family toxin [Peptococcaceae bacterium]